jgi:multicomponent K+:H+ antiporter subunit E
MKRLLPAPALSLGLFVLWILLAQSLSPGTLLLGVALALVWPALTARLAGGAPQPRRPAVMARLFLQVVGDMLRSNLAVASALIGRRQRTIRSSFVQIPLELADPAGLSVLAVIVTMTPGTAWVELSLDKRLLLIHAFDVQDEGALVAAIKDRYERPLKEIFE